jgi:hypothetical protein
MFFKFESGKDGIIKTISFDIEKLDESVKTHLREVLKGKIKFEGEKAILKCSMSLEELKTINDGFEQFHSQFILDSVINYKKD